jgi:NAD(P)-dependent dehydrogenase (short-subunit alcohol dehydrogenase family)
MATRENDRRVLLLTGASRGIGHATVKRFSAAGWRVITCSRHPFPGEDCPWEMGPEDHVQIDLGDVANTRAMIEEIRTRLPMGKLDALVNNAAVSPKKPGGARMGTLDTSLEDWQAVFQVNFFAPVLLARGLIRELEAAKGSVVNVSSITREMATDFGPLGVRVNAISPGEIETSILSPGTEKLVAQIPLHRLGQPDEVAKAIYFLCSDASSYVNGAELHIDGGQYV